MRNDTAFHPMAFAAGIEHYLTRKRARGARDNTIRAYGADLRQLAEFVTWLDATDLVALLTSRTIARWFDALSADDVSARTQARKLAVVRGFVKHALAEGWIKHDPTAGERVSFRARRVIAPEMDALLRIIDGIDGDKPDDVRDRALLRLAIDSGLRISEAASLDMPHMGCQATIDLRRRIAHVVGKGGDVETVPFNDATGRALDAWMRVREHIARPSEPALFVTASGKRPTRQTLHAIFKRRAAAAGVSGAHWHLMRHRRISQVVNACGIKIAQQFARHASASTTQLYGAHADQVAWALIRERVDIDATRAAA